VFWSDPTQHDGIVPGGSSHDNQSRLRAPVILVRSNPKARDAAADGCVTGKIKYWLPRVIANEHLLWTLRIKADSGLTGRILKEENTALSVSPCG